MLRSKHFMWAYGGVLAFLLLFFSYSTAMDPESRRVLLRENGPVEFLSALLHFACFGLFLVEGRLAFFKKHYYLVLLPLLLGLRELDFHKRFTTMDLFKSKFYVSAAVPFCEKIIGVVVLLGILLMVFMLCKNHLVRWGAGLKARSPVALGALLVVVLMGVSKSLDGLQRKMASLGWDLSDTLSRHSTSLEEILELGLPLMMIMTVFAYFHTRQEVARI